MVTTIQVDEKTKALLDKVKVHYRETYDELVKRLVYSYSNSHEKEELIETLEIMSDPDEMREIAEGIEAYSAGKGKSSRQLRMELRL